MIEGCGKYRGSSGSLMVYCRKHSLCKECKEKMYNTADMKSKIQSKKRAQVGVTFELMTKTFGFEDDIYLESVRVDNARNILSFYFRGGGLSEHSDSKWLDTLEGQECVEIVPPLWQENPNA